MLEYIKIDGTNLVSSRIALGTWAIGGWMWGGTDEKESIRTIHAALDQGINLIDTAPIYGYGRSEEIVGEALHQHGRRESVILATKVGIDWTNGKIERNSTRQRILKELEDSLRRLQTDYVDIYQVHWPDPFVPIEDSAALQSLRAQNRTRRSAVRSRPWHHRAHLRCPVPRIVERRHEPGSPVCERRYAQNQRPQVSGPAFRRVPQCSKQAGCICSQKL